MYDRSYAEVRNELWRTLTSVLPDKGELSIEREDVEMNVERYELLLPNDSFHIVLMGDDDVSYNEDTMTHRVVVPWHNFHVHKNQLFVGKTFDACVLRIIRQDTDVYADDLAVVNDTDTDFFTENIFKSRIKIPSDLLHASIEDMRKLNTLLRSYESGMVS
jgi:hypothetical protein